MILLTGYYHDPDAQRRGELIECVKRNAENDWIDEVRIFVEDNTAPEGLGLNHFTSTGKLRVIPAGERMTFRSLFDYANQNLQNQEVIVARKAVAGKTSYQPSCSSAQRMHIQYHSAGPMKVAE